MHARTLGAVAWLATLTAVLPGQVLPGREPLRRPADHQDRGLPDPAAVWAPFDAAVDHPANRVFRAAFLDRCIPAEVGNALPREHGEAAEFFAPGWYFGKRAGGAADERWFGGDGRQMPREGFAADESEALRRDLAALDGDLLTRLRREPRLCVYLQNDLLRLARRLLDTQQNRELLAPLLACARRLALPAATLAQLTPTFALADLAKAAPGLDPRRCVEIERRSSRLFDAQYSQAWSSVFVQWGADGAQAFADWLQASAGTKDGAAPVPIGTQAVLVQGLVALDDQGAARATPLVVDVRVQRLANRDALGVANRTTTRDGVDFRLWQLPRQTLRERGAATAFADFRALDTEDQELFRDYGTRKHTTIAAQCSLCHRRSNGPDEALGGFSALRPSSKPRPVQAADERPRRAEAEFLRFLAELTTAAK